MIAKIAIPLPIDHLFDYSIPTKLKNLIKVGSRVKILFNNKLIGGYVISFSSLSKIRRINPILDVIDEGPIFTDSTLKLVQKIKDYYICSLGQALDAMVPNILKRSIKLKSIRHYKQCINNKNPSTTYFQSFCRDTDINYFKEEIIRKVNNKERVIFVVPQINSLNETKEYFSKIEGLKIAIWCGKLPKKDMLNLWNDLSGDKIDLIIGTRSSIFAPLSNLGLIIVTEESDFSHKEDQVPYYHTTKIAQMRSEIEGCDVILSSQIPSVQTYYQSMVEKRIKSNFINKVTKLLPEVQFTKTNFKDKIDFILEKEIVSALEKKKRILIFLNKKGFATSLYCRKCKEAIKCCRCSSNLRFDYFRKELICPWCNYRTEVVEICPKCNSSYVKFSGFGTEKLESNLKRIFPQAKIILLDELTNVNNSLDFDIVIATKKIIDFPKLKFDITIIWDLDSLLNIGDFMASEYAYQLLSKLLLITTTKMFISSGIGQDFYLLKNLKDLNFKGFYNSELKIRKTLNLPPYYQMGLIALRSLDKKLVEQETNRIHYYIEKNKTKDIKISNPFQTLRWRLRDKYYKYLLIKSRNQVFLNKLLKKTLRENRNSKVVITVNIDPI